MPTSILCQLLPANEHALANAFYRRHGSSMKVRAMHRIWTAGAPEILACTCLQAVSGSGGHWLTSLFVDPDFRHRGFAGCLLEHVRSRVEGPIWLFCRPELSSLYQRHGYQPSSELPQSLSAKLARYQREKTLIAMLHPG